MDKELKITNPAVRLVPSQLIHRLTRNSVSLLPFPLSSMLWTKEPSR